LLLAASLMLLASCSSDSDSKKSDSKKSDDPRAKQVASAEEAYDAKPKDINACRNLGASYVTAGSPMSTGKKGEVPEIPEDRNEWLEKAAKVYEDCLELEGNNLDVKQSLASTYMGLSKYEDAAPLLEEIAKERKTDANSYYQWGLAASNARNTKDTITAFELFVKYAPKGDQRVKQIKESIKLLKQEDAA
jgi:tetratricopeptide (TPR) repeat protein